MITLAIILLVIGAGVFWAGWRGVRAGQHPHCVKCDFDLYNLPEETQRCPECGTYIRIGDAVRLGKRRPVAPVIAAGGILLVLGAALAVQSGTHHWHTLNASRLKPAAWLQADLDAREEALRRRASEELARRIRAGALTDAQLDALAAWVLDRQANPAVVWQPAWGDLVQAARATGRLSPTRWQTFLEKSLQVTARIRPRVRIGDPIPIEVTCTLRSGSDNAQLLPATVSPSVRIEFAGTTADLQARGTAVDIIPMPMHWLVLWMPGDTAWPAALAQPGPKQARVDVRLTLATAHPTGGTAVGGYTVDLPIEILPKDQPSVALGTATEAMTREMESAVKLRGGQGVQPARDPTIGSLWIGGPPMAGAFRIVLRQGGREWLLARTLVRMNDAVNLALRMPASSEVPRAGAAEVVCIPEPEGAVGTVEVMEIWPAEVRRPVTIEE